MLKINKITPEIYHLKFTESDELVLHFIRFSEYYESDNTNLFRKKFTLNEAIDSYKKSRGVNYLDEINGFNLPVSMIGLMAGEFDRSLTEREKFILALIETIKVQTGSNIKYVIGTYGKNRELDEIHHELAHAFYYTDPVYRLQMDAEIRNLSKAVKEEVFKFLKKECYNQAVFSDECQAYMATGFDIEELSMNVKLVNLFRAPFVDIFLGALSKHEIV